MGAARIREVWPRIGVTRASQLRGLHHLCGSKGDGRATTVCRRRFRTHRSRTSSVANPGPPGAAAPTLQAPAAYNQVEARLWSVSRSGIPIIVILRVVAGPRLRIRPCDVAGLWGRFACGPCVEPARALAPRRCPSASMQAALLAGLSGSAPVGERRCPSAEIGTAGQKR